MRTDPRGVAIFTQDQASLKEILMANIERYCAPGVFDPPTYSQGIKVTGAQTILFLAGQVAYDDKGQPAHRGDFVAQARAVLRAVKAQVEAGGGTMASIVNRSSTRARACAPGVVARTRRGSACARAARAGAAAAATRPSTRAPRRSCVARRAAFARLRSARRATPDERAGSHDHHPLPDAH